MAGYAVQEDDEVLIEELPNDNKSAFQSSKDKAKDLSYYYAHQPESEKGFPSEAVIRQVADPSKVADGMGPKQLGGNKKVELDNVRWIDSMSYSDDGKLVKVYIDFPEDIKGSEITCEWERFGVELIVQCPSGKIFGVRVRDAEGWILEHERKNGFAHEIVPEKCKYRVSSSGPKISLTLAKKDENEKWYELKKKDIRSTF
eukprot:CAMPEP_0197661566 /NCGR_PEP_ID=MMETSP1338-20131121/51526_1 /TAXON_ID=43686 ORGANISM="Pelagodinium beii, Strain RCC1491" /NCGR_SAMPLE_ID=MMETSP1338 /ASSEMBLY_ACC=CAM_ASM_000754 /LENGTH=200 /DNA_ID=CAMNT_0043239135 /DNA_START=39 /DNA_END=641 /DNA_ORIENTATION=+